MWSAIRIIVNVKRMNKYHRSSLVTENKTALSLSMISNQFTQIASKIDKKNWKKWQKTTKISEYLFNLKYKILFFSNVWIYFSNFMVFSMKLGKYENFKLFFFSLFFSNQLSFSLKYDSIKSTVVFAESRCFFLNLSLEFEFSKIFKVVYTSAASNI